MRLSANCNIFKNKIMIVDILNNLRIECWSLSNKILGTSYLVNFDLIVQLTLNKENILWLIMTSMMPAVTTLRNLPTQIHNIARYLDGATDLAVIFPTKYCSSYGFKKINYEVNNRNTMIIFKIIIIAYCFLLFFILLQLSTSCENIYPIEILYRA